MKKLIWVAFELNASIIKLLNSSDALQLVNVGLSALCTYLIASDVSPKKQLEKDVLEKKFQF